MTSPHGSVLSDLPPADPDIGNEDESRVAIYDAYIPLRELLIAEAVEAMLAELGVNVTCTHRNEFLITAPRDVCLRIAHFIDAKPKDHILREARILFNIQ